MAESTRFIPGTEESTWRVGTRIMDIGSELYLPTKAQRASRLGRILSIPLELSRRREDEVTAAITLANQIKETAKTHVDRFGNPIDTRVHKLKTPDLGIAYLTVDGKNVSLSWDDSVEEGFHISTGRANLYIDTETRQYDATLDIHQWLNNKGKDITPGNLRTKLPRAKLDLRREELNFLADSLSFGGTFIERAQFPQPISVDYNNSG